MFSHMKTYAFVLLLWKEILKTYKVVFLYNTAPGHKKSWNIVSAIYQTLLLCITPYSFHIRVCSFLHNGRVPVF